LKFKYSDKEVIQDVTGLSTLQGITEGYIGRKKINHKFRR